MCYNLFVEILSEIIVIFLLALVHLIIRYLRLRFKTKKQSKIILYEAHSKIVLPSEPNVNFFNELEVSSKITDERYFKKSTPLFLNKKNLISNGNSFT